MRQGRWARVCDAWDRSAGLAILLASLLRHAMRAPSGGSLEQRLAMLPRTGLPLDRPATIFWDRHQVPYIEAASDDDLAVALGVVHAHLRLGQIELLRHIAWGRVAELIGPSGIAVDHLLRAVDFPRAVPAIEASLPQPTQAWLQAFVRGLNHYLEQVRPLPPEFDLFGIRPEPWRVADILALGRLVSADVSWVPWFQLLRFRGDEDWPSLWRRVISADSLSRGNGTDAMPVSDALRGGSNSFAVASTRTASGGAMIASDPHLSIVLPNAWLLAVIRSPSMHAAGLMIPGLPFVALGRNPWIAWGGTSLHAASSDLVRMPDDCEAPITEREVEVAVRWGRSRRLRIREAPWGPIITDVPLLAAGNETLALRWMGHLPSDETTAMLAVNRARNWTEFGSALQGFAVPGQSMTYADTTGRGGRLRAVRLPRRPGAGSDDMATDAGAADGWDAPVTCAALPSIADPPEGYIASANERPPEAGVLIGRHFSRPDRKRRLDRLLSGTEPITVETAVRIQHDVHAAAMLNNCRGLLEWIDGPGSARERRLIDELRAWDGSYDAASRGALVFEILSFHLARRLVPARRWAAYAAAWGTRTLIWDEVAGAEPRQRQRALRQALRKTANTVGARETWGDRHRLRLGHTLAMVPGMGRAWRFADLSVGGSNDTLMKTAHMLTHRQHGSRYGSVARQICDLSDLDRSYFVLLGGQDGWLGSTTFLDQVALWRRGEYITLPLRPQTARRTFLLSTELTP